jgi:K+-transporting ATPase ATPase C chain
MLANLRPAVCLLAGLSLITGVVYPLTVTAVARVAFPGKAGGSIIRDGNSAAIGSVLVGQEFGTSDPAAAPALAKWFWGRPSATGPVPYTALNLDKGTGSSGSNLAPTNPAVLDNVRARLMALNAADASVGLSRAAAEARVPIDLVTSSASGLDPHISPASAEYQVARVARARNMSSEAVRALVRQHTSGRALGVLGEPVVNVLELNLAIENAPR